MSQEPRGGSASTFGNFNALTRGAALSKKKPGRAKPRKKPKRKK